MSEHTNDLDSIEARARSVQPPGRPMEYGSLRWFVSGANIGDRSGGVVAYDVPDWAARDHIAGMDPEQTLALVAEVRELRAKVARTQGMHAPSAVSGCCRSCGQSTPCPTTRALAGDA